MIKSRNIVVFILIISMVSLVGCSSKSSAEKKPSTSVGQKPKAPTELKSMSTELDKLITELDKKFKQKMPAMQQNIQLNPQGKSQGGQAQSGQSQGGQSQGTQSQDGQSQGGQSQGTQSQGGQAQGGQTQGTQSQSGQAQGGQQAIDWQKEFSSLKTIHTNWNSLMPEAVGAGMTIDSRNQFSTTLEQLTQNISNQKLEDSISSTLMLYKNYADLTQVFTTTVPAEYYQVKYEIMAAIFEATRKNWTAAQEHAPKIKEHWVYLSAQAKESDLQIINRTDFSISDLQQAITSKQMELVMIKGEIAMTNLKSLEGKLSSQTSNQGQ
ncbi:MAG: hypothetical protein PHZ03_08330 [Syntrophomonas sp.]|nr:hypothetical protein [Syntrophomonas sp.]